MSKFQLIFIGIFVICILTGVTLFATYKGKDAQNALPAITVWGTFPESVFTSFLREYNNTQVAALSINYVEKKAANFDKDFIEALARGQGPDAVLLPQDMLYRHFDKIVPIPFTVLSERDFRNTYVQQAELYLSSKGSMALPFTVDPLVMYWNRDMFTNAGIATYPRLWEDFKNVNTKITVKDDNANIRKSALALGQFDNISHAREILGTLMMQAGSSVTQIRENRLQSTIAQYSTNGNSVASPAIEYFIQFSDPRSANYSWNRSLPSSKNWFLSGNLATYFGYASELFDLRAKNPNLDFDVAPFPQAKNAKNRITYGAMYGLSIVRTASNQGIVFSILSSLISPGALSILNRLSYLPPVRRDMISAGSSDPYQTIFFDSALISRGWLDMDTTNTNKILSAMIESISSGRSMLYEAIKNAEDSLNLSFNN